LTGLIIALAFASTIGNLRYKEAPLQDPHPEPERAYYTATFETTAYCACSKCCGKSDGITASGTRAAQGRTIAAPSTYDFGTEIEIDGNIYVVEDRGGAIKDNRIDIFFDSHQEANNYGRKTVEGKVFY
jgi:3D (Asp-Asp-Asp) domain-containing protein